MYYVLVVVLQQEKMVVQRTMLEWWDLAAIRGEVVSQR